MLFVSQHLAQGGPGCSARATRCRERSKSRHCRKNTPIHIHKDTFISAAALARAYTLVSTIAFAFTLTTTLALMGTTACTYTSAIAPHDPADTFTIIVTQTRS